jgi:hypothetical protein
MLYFNTRGGQHIVILEPENLEAVKAGQFAKSPNKAVLIAYTPDAGWLGEQIVANVNNLTPELLDRLIAESQQRPEKRGRAHHPMMEVIKDGKVQGGES